MDQTTQPVPAATSLTSCAQWPVMLVLPEPVASRLASVTAMASSIDGAPVFRKDVVAALVTLKAPTTAPELAKLYEEYVSSTSFDRPPLLLPTKHVTLALPSPVSHRLDLLVEATRPRVRPVLRRDIVAALVTLRSPSTEQEAFDLHRRYRLCEARDAWLRPFPLRRVLALNRPKPGRRPS